MNAKSRRWLVQGQSGFDMEIERVCLDIHLKHVAGEAVFPDASESLLPLLEALEEARLEASALKYAAEGQPAVRMCHMCGLAVFVEKLEPGQVFCRSTLKRECHEFETTWRQEKRRRA